MIGVKNTTLILLSSLILGCGSSEDKPKIPVPKVTWQWQLQGDINTSYDVDMYDIDLFNTKQEIIDDLLSRDKQVICYFSAGSYEDYRADSDKFLEEDKGDELDGWDGEYWLDIRSANVRSIMLDRLDLAVDKNCSGVEPDNVDGYTNINGFNLTYGDQLDYNKFIATEAKQRGLKVVLKNDLKQIKDLVDYYDYALNEQCHINNECEYLTPFTDLGKPVFNAEYNKKYVNDENTREELCKDAISNDIRTLVLPQALDNSLRYSCDD